MEPEISRNHSIMSHLFMHPRPYICFHRGGLRPCAAAAAPQPPLSRPPVPPLFAPQPTPTNSLLLHRNKHLRTPLRQPHQ